MISIDDCVDATSTSIAIANHNDPQHRRARRSRRAAVATSRRFSSSSQASCGPEADPAAPGIIAVVKANAYGHGAERVALALEQAGATMLACADIEEGIVLRRAGVRVPILVFGALSVSDLDGAVRVRR